MYTPLLTPFPFTTPSPSPKLRAVPPAACVPIPFLSPISGQAQPPLSCPLLWTAMSTRFIAPRFSICSPLGSTLCWPSLILSVSALYHSLLCWSAFFFYYDSYLLVPKGRDRASQCSEYAFLSFSINVFSDPIKQNMFFHPSRLFSSCFPSSLSLPYRSYSCSRCSDAPASK